MTETKGQFLNKDGEWQTMFGEKLDRVVLEAFAEALENTMTENKIKELQEELDTMKETNKNLHNDARLARADHNRVLDMYRDLESEHTKQGFRLACKVGEIESLEKDLEKSKSELQKKTDSIQMMVDIVTKLGFDIHTLKLENAELKENRYD